MKTDKKHIICAIWQLLSNVVTLFGFIIQDYFVLIWCKLLNKVQFLQIYHKAGHVYNLKLPCIWSDGSEFSL